MQENFRLGNPPIQEALISVGLAFDTPLTTENLEKYHNLTIEDFPNKNFSQSVMFSFGNQQEPIVEQGVADGVLLKSLDGQKVTQLSNNIFTVNYIQNYSTWEALMADFIKYFTLAKENFPLIRVMNISTRFINRIPLDKQSEKIDDLFETYIHFKDTQVDYPKEYLVQYIKDCGDVKCNVIQTKDLRSETDTTEYIILDIETVYTKNITMEDITNASHELWSDLHDTKNTVFFETITEKARGKFA